MRIPRRASKDHPIYEATTHDVVVRVAPAYLPDQSDPVESRYVWAYMIEIENHGAEPVQLISRRWLITDANNRTETVAGAGVVGEQPRLKPHEAFRYTSACPLSTSSGDMRGTYQMVTDHGESFEVEIPPFSLHLPEASRTLN